MGMPRSSSLESLMRFSKAEVDAVIAASPHITVPFSKLVLSQDFQVRPSGSTSKLSIAELAASIRASGVLQNLIVSKGQRRTFEVCAGGRRLEALALLVSNGDIPDNSPVPVLVVPPDKALIASLAENCFHEPLHISAEIEGMARSRNAVGQVVRTARTDGCADRGRR